MLTKEKLIKLNNYMLGLGEPIEKNAVGYNKPDYYKMYYISHVKSATNLTDQDCCIICYTLAHYQNTQLKKYKQEIIDTLTYYLDLFNEVDPINLGSILSVSDHPSDELRKNKLKLISKNDTGIIVKFNEYVEGFNPYKLGCAWQNGGIYVPYSCYNAFIAAVSNVGKYGYESTPIIDFIVSQHCTNNIQSTITCTNLHKVNKYGLLEFKIDTNTQELAGILWALKTKEDCVKYVDNKTDSSYMIISISYSQVKKFIEEIKKLNIQVDEKDALAEVEQFDNDNTAQLVDYTKFQLPFQPYQFQIDDAKKIITKKRALLGHEMGCGKTFISVLLGESLDNTTKLVVCPESLRLNWKKEILQVNPSVDIQILTSGKDEITAKDWIICGYSLLYKFVEQLKEKINCIFVDECQYCKSVGTGGIPTSKRAEAVIQLALSVEYCYLLSGTPVPTRNMDLFNILRMLRCEKFNWLDIKRTYFAYGNKYCDGKHNYFGWDFSGNSNSDELHAILSKDMVRRLKKDVLPDLHKQRQFVPLDTKFTKEYKDIERRLFYPEDGDTYMGLAMTGRRLLSKSRVDDAIDLVESLIESENSVVVVTLFKETEELLLQHFQDASVIIGGMSDEEKQMNIDLFQHKKTNVCILNLICGGVGLTLTAAHTMVIVDYDWTPSNMIQVEDRICRTGQDQFCTIYYLYSEKSIIDATFIEMISNKSDNISLVVDNAENDFNLIEQKTNSNIYLAVLKEKIKEEKDKIKKSTKTTKKKKA